MKKLRFLCIAPYEGMYHLMTNIAAQRGDVELIIQTGNLDDGLKTALNNRRGIDAVISRGGTADTLRGHMDIPICDIVPSAYDILRTIRLAQGMDESFAIVGYPSITHSAEKLCEIMQFSIPTVTIRSPQECCEKLAALRDGGTRIIVGDMIAATSAHEYGMHGLLIVSGIESIESAINAAKDICLRYQALDRRASLLCDLLVSDERDFAVYSPDGREVFTTLDPVPPELAGAMRQHVSHVLARSSVKLSRRLENEMFTVRGRLLVSGGEEYAVFSISRAPALFSSRQAIRFCDLSSGADGTLNSNPLEYYLGSNAAAERLRAICEQYASLDAPVLIEGDYGTGKDRFAQYIHSRSRLRHSPLVLVDIGRLTDRDWETLLEDDRSPLADTGSTIYLRHLDTVSRDFAPRLLDYLEGSHTLSANRFLVSYSGDAGRYSHDPIYAYLSETVHALRLRLPPLSRRRDDIPTLVTLYINATNVRFGTRVIGLTREAMLLLQNFPWPRNIDQLVKCVQELVVNADSSYISEAQVRAVLDREKAPPSAAAEGINLNRPLAEITREVVLRVYELEGQNQTKTAQHLDISRSTLWRMLK
ncbi:MAG: PrpR N-terminal domain-containing protein [Oscillospiraceae bacterium]